MGLNSFVAMEPRPLPIFVLVDTSGSMRGQKINQVNLALRSMVTTLNEADDIRGRFQLCVISFGSDVTIVQDLADIDSLTIPELEAAGRTSMGKAFEVVKNLIEDRDTVSSRAYTPTIVLVSDGIPTDCPRAISESGAYAEWEPLSSLSMQGRSSKCQRLALGIGDDADVDMLKTFIGNPIIPLVKAKGAEKIAEFFNWVSMSTVARIKSVKPDNPEFVMPLYDLEDDSLF